MTLKRTIVIFGPPGSGKTTLTPLVAHLLHWRAIDLEAIWESDLRTQVQNYLLKRIDEDHEQVIGAAGTQLDNYPSTALRVLLLPDPIDYAMLLAIRSIKQPKKMGQNEIQVWNKMFRKRSQFDLVITEPNILNQCALNAIRIVEVWRERSGRND